MLRLPCALASDLDAPARWPALDGVRGVAVIAVVLYHAYRLAVAGVGVDGREVQPATWWWPAGTARFALDVFFVLSGFLVVRSWGALRRRCGAPLPALRAFAARRALRVVPAYWVSLAVLVPLVAPHLLRGEHRGDLVLLLTMQQYVEAGLPAAVNTVYWSLTTEVHFYLLVPVLAVLLRRRPGWQAFAGAVALTVLWRAGLRGDLAPSLLLGRSDQFVIGALASAAVADWERGTTRPLVALLRRRYVGPLLVTALLALGTYHGSTLGMARGTVLDLFLHPAVGLIVAALLVRVLCGGGRVLQHPALRAPGLVSYSVYLWHYPLLDWGLRLSTSHGLGPAATVAACAVLVILAFAVGLVSYLCVERPAMRRGRDSDPRSAGPQEPRVAAAGLTS